MYMRIMRTIYTGTGLRSKYLSLFVFMMSVILCLSSCTFQNNTPDVIVEYQIPFAKSGSRWNENELLDEDEYGRKLYSYKSGKAYTNVFRDYMGIDYRNAPVLMYIIVQKTEKDFVYCYDDFCYAYVTSFENDNSDIVNNLKDVNDWGNPFNDEKTTALSVSEFENIDRYPIYSVEESVVKTLENLINYEIEDYYIDDIFLEDTTPIFVLREVTNRDRHEFGKSYIFHIPKDDSNVTYLELSDDIQNWNEEIHNFKATLKAEETDAVNE